MNNKSTLCPVCGYDLGFEPWEGGFASNESCLCCGIEFGYHDDPDASGIQGSREQIYIQWRNKWIDSGMMWATDESGIPDNWDPNIQLKKILDIE